MVLETRNGRRNLDVILERLGSSKGPSKPAPEPDRTGAVSPITVTLRDVRIDDLGVEVVGEGPQLAVRGLHARLGASVDPRRIDAGLDIRAAHGGREGAVLQAVLTSSTGQPDLRVTGRVLLGLTSTVAAKASRGLTVEDMSAALEVGLGRLRAGQAGFGWRWQSRAIQSPSPLSCNLGLDHLEPAVGLSWKQ